MNPQFFIAAEASHAIGMVFWQAEPDVLADVLVERLCADPTWWEDEFIAAALLAAQDGQRVALYGQWTSQPTAEAALRRAARAAGAPTDSGLFELAARLPKGHELAIRQGDVVALGEFWTTPEQQSDLIAREPEAAAKALANGGILTANFHRSLDGLWVVNLAQLGDAKAVERLAAKPGFSPQSGYWRALARNEYHVYDIVRVLLAGRRGSLIQLKPTP